MGNEPITSGKAQGVTAVLMSTKASPHSVLVEAAAAGRLAPSVHNTQPWTFVIDGDHLDLVADESRKLHSLDPLGRELTIGCGAALFNMRVVLAAWGYEAIVHRLPDPSRPEVLARVSVGDILRSPAALAPLEPLLTLRRTNRRQFDHLAVPEDVVDTLRLIAREYGTDLIEVTDPTDRLALARLAQLADQIQNADPRYRAELRTWITNDPERRDGVPIDAVPHVDGSATDDIPIRDFDVFGSGQLPAQTNSGRKQCLLLLCSDGDEPADWIRVGEALEHLWLEVTRLGYVASPLTQTTEVPSANTTLRRELRLDTHPQVLLRIGKAAGTPPTPRRDADDVIHTVDDPDQLG